MSKLPPALQLDEQTAQMLLAAQCHLGAKNCESAMSGYVYGRRPDGRTTHYITFLMLL